MALRHSLWIILFSIQDRAGFYEHIMRISRQNNEEPYLEKDPLLPLCNFPKKYRTYALEVQNQVQSAL